MVKKDTNMEMLQFLIDHLNHSGGGVGRVECVAERGRPGGVGVLDLEHAPAVGVVGQVRAGGVAQDGLQAVVHDAPASAARTTRDWRISTATPMCVQRAVTQAGDGRRASGQSTGTRRGK
jgi:hypothetical protein